MAICMKPTTMQMWNWAEYSSPNPMLVGIRLIESRNIHWVVTLLEVRCVSYRYPATENGHKMGEKVDGELLNILKLSEKGVSKT